jgi:transcription antitermination protein NusB
MTMNPRSASRSAARLAAVQALYQHHMEATPQARLYADAEVDFFDDLVIGVLARMDEIDALVTARLAEGWTLARLDKTMVQILRAGTFELLARPDVSKATVISEYVDVAHAFFDEREAKFVNGVLDALAKAVRV